MPALYDIDERASLADPRGHVSSINTLRLGGNGLREVIAIREIVVDSMRRGLDPEDLLGHLPGKMERTTIRYAFIRQISYELEESLSIEDEKNLNESLQIRYLSGRIKFEKVDPCKDMQWYVEAVDPECWLSAVISMVMPVPRWCQY